jgi:hypothetical protein
MKTLPALILTSSSSEKTVTVEDCQLCYDFVTESAVHIQAFDFETKG